MTLETRNPATGAVIQQYSVYTQTEVEQKIQAADHTFRQWRKVSFKKRGELMLKLAQLLKQRKQDLAFLIAQEMGKPISAGMIEIEKCAWVCEHYAEMAEHYLASKIVQTQFQKSIVTYQPLGVVFGIMPWNFPFWQVFRYAVPTLMAGNTVLLKHAPISTGTALWIEKLFLEAGFPQDIFQTLLIETEMAEYVIAHPAVVAVTLTGSERAGRSVAACAGQHLKRVVLELGGNDPYLILADADLNLAAKAIVTSRLNNAGQSCIAAKRIIVVASILEPFIACVLQEMKRYTLGDPTLSSTTMGPIARKDLRDTLHQQVVVSQAKGAKLMVGGIIPDGPGYYYPPTLLTQVKPGMPAFDEELFGPVLSIITASSEQEAIQLANQSSFGLGGGIFTQDLQRGEHIATYEIETGTCFVNQFVSSDPRLPFGGIKQSGFGRELSREGILEFVNIKTIGVGG